MKKLIVIGMILSFICTGCGSYCYPYSSSYSSYGPFSLRSWVGMSTSQFVEYNREAWNAGFIDHVEASSTRNVYRGREYYWTSNYYFFYFNNAGIMYKMDQGSR